MRRVCRWVIFRFVWWGVWVDWGWVGQDRGVLELIRQPRLVHSTKSARPSLAPPHMLTARSVRGDRVRLALAARDGHRLGVRHRLERAPVLRAPQERAARYRQVARRRGAA